MKLACQRCKRKKIKCDKAAPVCHQCVIAKTECQYLERRQRPRLAQQRGATTSLNQRLELLEKQISNVGHRAELAPQRSRSVSASVTTSTSDNANRDLAIDSPPTATFRATESGEDLWVYRMATDTKKQLQSQTTPITTPTPQIDTDMSALNDALEDLGKLKLRANLIQGRVVLTIPLEEAKHCLESFIEMMNTLVVPGAFTAALDVNLLRSLPYVIDSPHIKVDPGVHVMYFAAIYYGLNQTRGPGDTLTQTAYLKALEHVPAWLEAPTGTSMDGYTAALSAWVAINNLDYQLSWKFHLKSCHYLKSKGIDNLDATPANSIKEEEEREPLRYLFWQVLSTDCLFRLFWGRPTVLRWKPQTVRPPAVLHPKHMHPHPTQVMLLCIWIDYTSRTIEQISSIDNATAEGISVSHDVDDCCRKLEVIVADWKMEATMKDMTVPFSLRCVVADHIMNISAVIVGLKRLANRVDKISDVDAITIRAARTIVRTLLYFDQDGSARVQKKPGSTNYFIHFMNFYPFCAVFTLYEHIMACTNPEECEEDVRQLERVADAMEHTSKTILSDLKPFTKTIKALNRVCRTIQDDRRNKMPSSSGGQLAGSDDTQQQSTNLNFNTAMPDLDLSAFDTIPDFPMTMDGDLDPLGFVRAMENDFIGRNWNENWWDIGDTVNDVLSQVNSRQLYRCQHQTLDETDLLTY
ncbi:hypothetical protein C7974DRAFT_57842 [Boeremia exigua]|uniref:uncharacterized protein n=1 Tax=Boeremia exigua TaxID=749465 RepID=UPI001E8DEA85|nr:uncharacterized protein C7974DRAFT_57842 [Boeremia exigua]KAH6615047.1 hypothetical protein C7974DRAFT_57842 [Boeremia exigua]